jgi:outer membrane protein assembly factor BamB
VSGSSPVIDPQGNIYLGVNNTFVALNPAGIKKWDFGYPVIQGAAAVAADGTIYAGGTGSVGTLYGWAADGALKFFPDMGGAVMGSPAIARDGTVYIGAMTTICEAFKGGAVLARGGWPKFRGNAAQNGRAGAN